MHVDLFLIHNLFGVDRHFLDVSVLKLRLDYHSSVITREFVLEKIAAFPFLLCYYLFSFITNIINFSLQRCTCFEIECSEHWSWTHVLLVNQELLTLLEVELWFPSDSCPNVNHIVVINRSVLWFRPIGITNKQKLVRSHLPHSFQSALNLVHTIRFSNFIGEGVLLYLSLRLFP